MIGYSLLQVEKITSLDLSGVADVNDPMAAELSPILSQLLGYSVSCSDDLSIN